MTRLDFSSTVERHQRLRADHDAEHEQADEDERHAPVEPDVDVCRSHVADRDRRRAVATA